MASLAAYFDANGSGSDKAGVLYVSGFVSTDLDWLAFERCWLEVLSDFEITPPFHMNEFAVGARQYASWKDDKERRAECLSRLIGLCLRHTRHSFSSGVDLLAFRRLDAEYRLAETLGYPYGLGATMTMHRLVNWMRANGLEQEPVDVVLERGDLHQGLWMSRMESLGFAFRFLPKDQAVPFQAADVLAYEHGKLYKDAASKRVTRSWQVRKSFKAFEAHGASDWGYHDARTLRAWCERDQVPRR